MMSRLLLAASIFCLLLPALTLADDNVWVNPPATSWKKQLPGLVHKTFESEAMKRRVGYSVVLPPSYEKSVKRYPVVYWLHGGGGNESSSLFTAKSWRTLFASKLCNEVILVYPSAFRSGYMDHHDGKVMVETMVIRELIPLIDKQYRTIAKRESRAVHGFSMGSSGSLKFAFKYPDLFCAAVAYGGGAIDLENTKMRFVLDIRKRNLDDDPELIRQNNTFHFLKQNGEVVRKNNTRFLLICGEEDTWLDSAINFHEALRKQKISCRLLTVPDVGHSVSRLPAETGLAAAMFQDRIFYPPAGPANAIDQKEVTTFNDAYFSVAERRKQSFQITLPPGYSTDTLYPLFVQQYGAALMLPTRKRPYIRVRPSARGVWGFRSMSRYDIMQIIEHTKRHYQVDEDRVYITGASAGPTGVMHAAAQRPDMFAGVVPLVAFGTDLPLENFANLPLRCEHGVNDWTSAIGNVRVQFQKLHAMKYDAALHEHPTAGHGIRAPPPKTMDWLFKLKRNNHPSRIVYSCEHPRDGRAYWLRIRTLIDPHVITRIEATVISDRVVITTANVKRFEVDVRNPALGSVRQVAIDGTSVKIHPDQQPQLTTFQRRDTWKRESKSERPDNTIAKYGAGAAANLFQGEPLLVVYGTEGDAAENRFLRQAAQILARSGGPDFKPANVRFPLRADSDVSEVDSRDYNLLLVGTPGNNSHLRKLAAKFPHRVEQNQLLAGQRQPLTLNDAVLSFHYYNPAHLQRLIYVVSPYLAENDRVTFLKNPRKYLAGSDGFKMIDQPDLVVRGRDLRIRREMQFDADWNFIQLPGADQRVLDSYTDRTQLALAHLKVMQKSAKVDLAIWWGPKDKGLFGGYDFNWLPTLDPTSYTLADFAVRRRAAETMTAELPGDELLDIFDRWITSDELVVWPRLTRAKIQEDVSYTIVIPMDLVPKLGIRKKTLHNVSPGPQITPTDVAQEIITR